MSRASKYKDVTCMFPDLVKEDPDLLFKASSVAGYICLGDGTMWDLKHHERVDCSPKVVFTSCLAYVPKDRNEALVDVVKQQLFVNPLGKEQGHFMLNSFSRAIGKHIGDKRLYLMIGSANGGKGVIINAMEAAFQGLVGHYNNEDLIYKRGGTDSAKSLSWVKALSSASIGFANEVELGEGCYLSGNIIKKLASGGDVIQARQNFQDESSFVLPTTCFSAMNDLPNIKPLDEGVRNRLITFDFQKTFVDTVRNPDYELQGDTDIKDKIKTLDWKSALFWAVLDAYTSDKVEPPKEVIKFKEEIIEDESDETKISKLFVKSVNPKDFTTTDVFHKRVQSEGLVMTKTKLSRTMKKLGFPSRVMKIGGQTTKVYDLVLKQEEVTL